jgi:hypothetical protein
MINAVETGLTDQRVVHNNKSVIVHVLVYSKVYSKARCAHMHWWHLTPHAELHGVWRMDLLVRLW